MIGVYISGTVVTVLTAYELMKEREYVKIVRPQLNTRAYVN
jgi:hypothetical protein